MALHSAADDDPDDLHRVNAAEAGDDLVRMSRWTYAVGELHARAAAGDRRARRFVAAHRKTFTDLAAAYDAVSAVEYPNTMSIAEMQAAARPAQKRATAARKAAELLAGGWLIQQRRALAPAGRDASRPGPRQRSRGRSARRTPARPDDDPEPPVAAEAAA